MRYKERIAEPAARCELPIRPSCSSEWTRSDFAYANYLFRKPHQIHTAAVDVCVGMPQFGRCRSPPAQYFVSRVRFELLVVAANTDAVPATSTQIPSRVAPQAKNDAAVSPHPAMTGTPAVSPLRLAMARVTLPTTTLDSTIRGNLPISTSNVLQRAGVPMLRRLSANPLKCK